MNLNACSNLNACVNCWSSLHLRVHACERRYTLYTFDGMLYMLVCLPAVHALRAVGTQ